MENKKSLKSVSSLHGGVRGTEKQQERRARDERICLEYSRLREKFPDLKGQRIFEEISKGYPISAAAVRAVCRRCGVC